MPISPFTHCPRLHTRLQFLLWRNGSIVGCHRKQFLLSGASPCVHLIHRQESGVRGQEFPSIPLPKVAVGVSGRPLQLRLALWSICWQVSLSDFLLPKPPDREGSPSTQPFRTHCLPVNLAWPGHVDVASPDVPASSVSVHTHCLV